jgi:hypothetical protein
MAFDEGIFIGHPSHNLWSGIDVGCRDVHFQSDDAPNLADVGAAQALEFTLGHLLRIANNAALSTSQGDINDCALPGHPGRKGTHRVDGLVWMEAKSTLCRTARVVVLNTKTTVNLCSPIVHLNRQRDMQFAQRPTQEFMYRGVQLEKCGRLIKLLLSDRKRVEFRCGF